MCNWSAKLKHCNVLHYVLLDWVCVHRQDRHTDRKWHAVQRMFHKRFEICGELTFNFVFFFTLCFNNTCTLKFKSRLMIAHWLLVDRRPTLKFEAWWKLSADSWPFISLVGQQMRATSQLTVGPKKITTKSFTFTVFSFAVDIHNCLYN